MKFMLDAIICIYVIKQQPQSVLERFISHPVGDLGISVITLAELEYGVSKSSNPVRNREAFEQFVSPLEVAAFGQSATLPMGNESTVGKAGTVDRLPG